MKPSVVVALVLGGSILGFFLGFVVAWQVFKEPQGQANPLIPGGPILAEAEKARKSAAKIQVRTLTMAVETYILQHMQNPPNLKSLLVKGERGGPYLKNQDAIIDPWGREFQYNMQGPRNDGIVPDIWCVTPDGQEIGNWAK